MHVWELATWEECKIRLRSDAQMTLEFTVPQIWRWTIFTQDHLTVVSWLICSRSSYFEIHLSFPFALRRGSSIKECRGILDQLQLWLLRTSHERNWVTIELADDFSWVLSVPEVLIPCLLSPLETVDLLWLILMFCMIGASIDGLDTLDWPLFTIVLSDMRLWYF